MWLLDRMLRHLVREGCLIVVAPDGAEHVYGDAASPPLRIRLAGRRTPWAIARDPGLGAGEAYMDGRLTVDPPHDIRDLLLLVTRNGWRLSREHPPGRLRRLAERVLRRLDQANPRRRARANVAHHYELSRRFYELFLDADRQYTMAYFRDPDDAQGLALERAQQDKAALIAAKLQLRPGMRVLDIGSGWGGLALYLHRVCGAEVVGISLAPDQVRFANMRAAQAGVSGKVRFELCDYRDVDTTLGKGRFDRITSVGMIEHVGAPHFREYFARTRELLADDGVMLTHTIGRLSPPGRTDAWTRRYIFPGGYIPALSELVTAIEDTAWEIADIEVLRYHYALTLAEWYRRTTANAAEITAMFDARMLRMWQFYLAGAEQSFRNGRMVNFHIVTTRERDALPMTREPIAAEAARLFALNRAT